MKNHFIPAVAAALLLVTALSSCETPAGQGAGFGAFSGAATGALIGAAATGTGQGAAIGAAAGAVAGALIGAAVAQIRRNIITLLRAVILMPARPAHRAMFTVRILRTT